MLLSEIKPNLPCPCGSELMAKLCCFPLKPPVEMLAPPYVQEEIVETYSPSMDAILSSNAPEPVKQVIKNMSSFTVTHTYSQESGPGLLSKEQANSQIAAVLGYSPNSYHLNTNHHEHRLISPLHSVKYHQQQCMYRLLSLQRQAKKRTRHSHKKQLEPKQVRILQVIQFEDLPLRVEFEAFSSRIASALDTLAKYVCDCTGKNKKKYGKHFELLNHLQKHQDTAPMFMALRDLYSEYESWSSTVIGDLRHVVMHEGTLWSLEPSKEMSIDMQFVPPSNYGRRIDELCVDHWRTLMDMVSSIRDVLTTYKVTE